MKKDTYPTRKELAIVKKWDAIADPLGLVSYVQDLWAYADYFHFDYATGALELHTVGWSGNESIIGALQDNQMFWMLYWWRSERGGHFYFTVKPCE